MLMVAVVAPILFAIYGGLYAESSAIFGGVWDVLINHVMPAAVVVIFWIYKSATPGKMLFNLRIVDAESMGGASRWQLVGRYLGYYVSTIPFFLGIFWVAIDDRKQGWHDKLAGTIVIRVKA